MSARACEASDLSTASSTASLPPSAKLLVLEFWGLGDLSFSTPLLRAAREHYHITLVGKEHAEALLQPSFPEIQFLAFDAPWSAYRGKYSLWKWNWPKLITLIARLRRERFDAAVSVRNDPRDHVLMWLIGARRRLGFPRKGSRTFLTDPLRRPSDKQHKVEDWRNIGAALGLKGMESAEPRLGCAQYCSELGNRIFAGITKPTICLHPGARIEVRRWPESFFARIIAGLREQFDFHLILIPDPDGFGSALAPLADTVLRPLEVRELVDVLGRCDLLLCNDSGPGHLAASCGRPVIPIFGPTDPDWFRPWGDVHRVIIRDICPLRPCFDYCAYSQPYCLTRLLPDGVWPEIAEHIRSLITRGILPQALAPVTSPAATPLLPSAPAPRKLDLVFSVADQNVATTKSIGIYNFSLSLLERLAVDPRVERLTVFTNETIPPLAAPAPNVRVEMRNYAVRSRTGRIFWDQRGVFQEALDTGQEWLFLPKGFGSFVARPGVRVAAYVHDIMGDFYRRNYPHFWSSLEFDYFARSLAATIQNAEIIFTNTEFTKSEIVGLARRLKLPVPKVIVAGYGFDRPEVKPMHKENRVLLFASNMPHKRTDIAIRFLDHWLAESRFDGTIDCIGIIPPEMEKPAGKAWNWIGRVPPAKGREMIRQSQVVVYVSEQEGFGMPPVEAALEGTCPVYSDLPPIREVMQEAGFPFSNDSKESFVEAMNQALRTSPVTLQDWSAALIARHNWDLVTGKIVEGLARS